MTFKPFKASRTGVQAWDLLLHQVSVYDVAASIAEEQQNLDVLMEIAEGVGKASDDLIGIILSLSMSEEDSEDEETNDKPPKFKHPIGFQHSGREPEEEEDLGAGSDEQE